MSSTPVFSKPTFTAAEMAAAAVELIPRLPRLVLAVLGRNRTDPRLRETVMLAVSEANRCRYCQTAHAEFGRCAGLSEEDLERLQQGRWRELEPRERAAVVNALRRAGYGVPDAGEENVALEEHFLPGEVADLAAFVDAIRFANLAGNTVDMLLGRILKTQRPRRDSTPLSEAAVAAVWAVGAVPASLGVAAVALARRLHERK